MTKRRGTSVAAAIYVRVSSERQARADKVSLQEQRERCESYCAAQGIAVTKVYEDAGVSGTLKPENRPALNRLLQDAEAKAFDQVVFYKMDRIARNTRALLNLVHDLDRHGVDVASVRESFDTRTPAGRFQLQVLAGVAQMEADTIAERTCDGRAGAIARGQFAGGAVPFWLRYDKEHRLWDWAEGDARTTVQAIVDWYLEGLSADAISHRLASTHQIPSDQSLHWRRGAKGRTGKGWRAATVMSILRSPALVGAIYFQLPEPSGEDDADEKHRISKQRAEARRRQLWRIINEARTLEEADALADEVGLVRVWQGVPAVVDWSTFRRIQDRRLDSRGVPKRKLKGWLLQGRIRCGLCERLFGAEDSGRGRSRFYRCSGRLRRVVMSDADKCSAPRLNYDDLITAVTERLAGLEADPANIVAMSQDALTSLDADLARLQARAGPVKEELVALDARRQRLARAWTDGVTTDAEYEVEKAALDRARAEAQRRRSDNDEHLLLLESTRDLAASIRESLADLVEGLAEADDARDLVRQALGRTLAERITKLDLRLTVYRDRADLAGALPLDALPLPLRGQRTDPTLCYVGSKDGRGSIPLKASIPITRGHRQWRQAATPPPGRPRGPTRAAARP